MTTAMVRTLEAMVATIPDGAKLGIVKDGSGVAMAATRALIRKGVRDLHLVTMPTSGLQADLLIGAGCVATVESAGVTMGEFGQAPCFGRAIREGALRMLDSTCPALYAALQAGEKGLPFMPLRGLIGSDILANRADYKLIDNPFHDEALPDGPPGEGAEKDPIVLLPAIRPDVALFHAPMADQAGNVYIGRHAELKILAHAARRTLVTVEKHYDGNLQEDPLLAAACLPSLYVDAIAVAPQGAWPLAQPGFYDADAAHLQAYMAQAASADGLAAYLNHHVMSQTAAAGQAAE